MKILVIEDETRSARRLIRMLRMLRPDAVIYGPLASVEASIVWFRANPDPDLVLLDIELEDGTAFDLLGAIEIAAPIIFCTAFADYALQAAKASSIDYLLKPPSESALSHALTRLDRLSDLKVPAQAWACLRGSPSTRVCRERFLVQTGNRLEVVPVDQIVAVMAWHKVSRLLLRSGETRMVDEPLKAVAATLSDRSFFQISRQVVLRFAAIVAIENREGRHFAVLAGREQCFPISRTRVSLLKATISQ